MTTETVRDIVTAPPRSSSPARWRAIVVGAAILLLVFILSSTSVIFRPAGTSWSAWWPASGVAIAVAARFRRRHLWQVAAVFGMVQIAASLFVGRELPLAVLGGVAVATEVWVGAAILRSRLDRQPRLETGGDLNRLMATALGASLVVGVIAGIGIAVIRGVDSYLPAVVAAVPAHAVGVLLIAPLILVRRGQSGIAGLAEKFGVWTLLTLVIVVSFGVNVGLPIAFLASVPLTWGATRLPPRHALWMMVVLAVAVTVFTLDGRGPFAVGKLPPDVSVLMINLFNLSFGIVSLTLTILTAQRRRLASTVLESATLFRSTFDFSPVGSAIITKTSTGPVVDQLNSAGRDLIGPTLQEPIDIAAYLSDESLAVFAEVVGGFGETGSAQWRGILTLRDGRSFQALFSRLPSTNDDDSFAIQFFDITDQLRVERAASEDLARAGEVQRALLPKELSPLEGYDIAGACVPAKTVGGDFYDWYRIQGGLAFSLGDVMGKGVGAGMIAATARAALRSARHDREVTVAVARAADTLETEVAEANSFMTLFHARLHAEDGSFQFTDAGHGLAIILRADETVQRLASSDAPLGLMSDSSWSSQHETLYPGDALIAVSDGVLDLYDGTLAALDHVADLARRAGSPSALAETLAGLAQQTAEPEDDSTILVIRRNA